MKSNLHEKIEFTRGRGRGRELAQINEIILQANKYNPPIEPQSKLVK